LQTLDFLVHLVESSCVARLLLFEIVPLFRQSIIDSLDFVGEQGQMFFHRQFRALLILKRFFIRFLNADFCV